MKKFLSLVLALTMLLSIGSVALAETTDEPVVIHVFHNMLEAGKNAGIALIEERFTALYPNVTFENTVYDQGTDYFTQLETAIVSGDMPELMCGNPGLYADLIAEGFVKDLSDNEAIKAMNLPAELLGDVSYEGKIYAYPVDLKTWGIFYNKAIFEQYGLEVPKTQTELLNICQTLVDNGVAPWAECYADASQTDIQMRPVVWTRAIQNGDFDMFEQLMNGTKKVTDYPYFREGLEAMQKRIGNWARPDAVSNSQTAADEVFVSGQAAMIYNGIWNHGSIEILARNSETPFEYDFFLCPMDDSGLGGALTMQVDMSMMVNPCSENPDWACKFMEFWMSECMDIWGEYSLQPGVTSVLNDETPDFLRDILATKEAGNAYCYGSFTKPFTSAYTSAYRKALTAFASYCCTGVATDGVDSIDSCLQYMQELFDNEHAQSLL